MDPTIISLIEKIGAPGGLTAVIGILLYILITVYKDLKASQDSRIEDAKKYNETLLAAVDKSNSTFAKVADAVDKAGVNDDKYSEKILNDLSKKASIEDIRQLMKELK